jgi:hypothetical protein
MAEMMAGERQRMAAEMAAQREEQERRFKEVEETQKLKMEEMRQDTMRRLSITQESNGAWSEDKSVTEIISARRFVGEDAETDIGDSVSVAPGIVLPGNVSQLVQDEVSR